MIFLPRMSLDMYFYVQLKPKIPRIDIIRITDVWKLRGHTEHRMHTRPLNVICTTHIRVCISSSQKAAFVLVQTKAISLVTLSAALVNSLPVPSSVLNFARQYQFSDSKESKEEMKSWQSEEISCTNPQNKWKELDGKCAFWIRITNNLKD